MFFDQYSTQGNSSKRDGYTLSVIRISHGQAKCLAHSGHSMQVDFGVWGRVLGRAMQQRHLAPQALAAGYGTIGFLEGCQGRR